MELQVLLEKLLSVLTGFSFQLSVGAVICCAFFKRKSHFLLRLLPCLAVFNLLPEIVSGRYENPMFMLGGWFTFSYLVMVALLVGILCFCYQLDPLDACNNVAAAYSVQHIIFNLNPLVRKVLGVQAMTAAERGVLSIAVELAVWCAFYYLFVKRVQNVEPMKEGKQAQTVFSCIMILIVYVVSLWARKMELMNSALWIYTILCCIFMLIIQFHIFERSKMQRDQEITKYLLQLSQKQYEKNANNIDLINIKCHDLKHQIGKLQHISDAEEREKFISETQEAIMIYDAFVKSGNRALDSVITEKGLVCQSKGIRLCSIIDGEALSFMEDADVYALFGNALDNAIASLEREPEDRRIISLNVTRQNTMVRIHMDNYCGSKLHFEDGLPKTTQENDDYHGFGCKSIRMIAEKYHGSVYMYQEGERFCTDILLLAER